MRVGAGDVEDLGGFGGDSPTSSPQLKPFGGRDSRSHPDVCTGGRLARPDVRARTGMSRRFCCSEIVGRPSLLAGHCDAETFLGVDVVVVVVVA
jgi:hypothetical protein